MFLNGTRWSARGQGLFGLERRRWKLDREVLLAAFLRIPIDRSFLVVVYSNRRRPGLVRFWCPIKIGCQKYNEGPQDKLME